VIDENATEEPELVETSQPVITRSPMTAKRGRPRKTDVASTTAILQRVEPIVSEVTEAAVPTPVDHAAAKVPLYLKSLNKYPTFTHRASPCTDTVTLLSSNGQVPLHKKSLAPR